MCIRDSPQRYTVQNLASLARIFLLYNLKYPELQWYVQHSRAGWKEAWFFPIVNQKKKRKASELGKSDLHSPVVVPIFSDGSRGDVPIFSDEALDEAMPTFPSRKLCKSVGWLYAYKSIY